MSRDFHFDVFAFRRARSKLPRKLRGLRALASPAGVSHPPFHSRAFGIEHEQSVCGVWVWKRERTHAMSRDFHFGLFAFRRARSKPPRKLRGLRALASPAGVTHFPFHSQATDIADTSFS